MPKWPAGLRSIELNIAVSFIGHIRTIEPASVEGAILRPQRLLLNWVALEARMGLDLLRLYTQPGVGQRWQCQDSWSCDQGVYLAISALERLPDYTRNCICRVAFWTLSAIHHWVATTIWPSLPVLFVAIEHPASLSLTYAEGAQSCLPHRVPRTQQGLSAGCTPPDLKFAQMSWPPVV